MALAQESTSVSIRDEVAAFKREKTILAAVDLFYHNGYANTTLDAVAEQLGVTKPFIYANFGSKGELLAEICTRGVGAALGAIDTVLPQKVTPSDGLRIFCEEYVTGILKSQKHLAVYTREEKNLEPADAKRIGDMRREFFSKVKQLLRRGINSGEFAIEDVHMTALAIAGAVTWSTFWYRPDGRLSLPEISDLMAKAILAMVGVKDKSPPRTVRRPKKAAR